MVESVWGGQPHLAHCRGGQPRLAHCRSSQPRLTHCPAQHHPAQSCTLTCCCFHPAAAATLLLQDLSEEELTRLREEVDNYTVEGDLRRFNALNIKRLKEIGCYRGRRHYNVGRSSGAAPAAPFVAL